MFNNLTPVVRNLLMINSIIFLVSVILPGLHLTEYLSMWNVRSENFKPYQLFTYMFMHGGFMHIFFNMMGLVLMGPMLEQVWGQPRFLAFYMITGIGAGVFNIAVDYTLGVGSFGLMMGASGAVYGVLTAYGILFPNREFHLLIPPISIKAKYLVLILGSIALISGFRASAGDNTAHFAHLGGIVVAIIFLQFGSRIGR
jgi:membrane associated rhomboid family serine protease